MSHSESERDVLLNRLADEFAARYRLGERPALTEPFPYAALSDLTTDTFTRYPNDPIIRISRSLETCSISSFRIALTLVREVPARLAISACVILSRAAISFRCLSRRC